jgi:thiosulfate/3-mercaptopyruvate sulfurtransferase
MNTKNIYGLLIIALLFVSKSFAQEIISAKDFVTLQKEKPIVVIDASKDKLYAQTHVDGAINIPYAALNEKDGKIEGLLLPVEEIAKILGTKGVSNEDTIVVYDESSQKYATRVYWILKYLGAKDVKLLHRENAGFRDARVKLTSAVPTVKAKTFTVNLNPEVFADTAFVEAAIGNPDVIIIDARSENEFKGIIDDKNTYSKGHIEGAINIPYESMVQKETNIFISPEEFAKLAGIELNPDKTYLVYCKTGVKGATLYAYLVNVMGFKNIKNYEGAYAEWDALGKPSVK